MAEFNTFDLGRVFQTAEAIKGLRRQEETDRLQQAFFRQRTTNDAAQETRAQGEFEAQMDARTARTKYLEAQAIETAEDPLAAARDFAPEMIQEFEKVHGHGSFEQLPPDVVKKIAGMGKQKAAAAAGISLQGTPEQQFAAAQAAKQAETQHGFRIGEIEATGAEARKTASVKPRQQFRTLTETELKQYGLPPGTSAQIDDATGKVDVLSKRDTSSTLSQKDATTAKIKLSTVRLARQQLNDIRDKFLGAKDPKTGQRDASKGIQGTMSAGPFGQGRAPTEGGHAFDRAVDQMRSTLTALTRVPGVGAMSDYETKLDQAKFPTRQEYESVTQQQIDALDNQLNAIESGYNDLLSGNQPQSGAPAQGAQPDPLGIR